MDNWHPIIVHPMALDRHREEIARGEAARRVAAVPSPHPVRARIDPTRHVPARDVAAFTAGTPA